MTIADSTPIPITLPAPTVDKIAELLERCDEFVRHADPAVRAELCAHLGPHADGVAPITRRT